MCISYSVKFWFTSSSVGVVVYSIVVYYLMRHRMIIGPIYGSIRIFVLETPRCIQFMYIFVVVILFFCGALILYSASLHGTQHVWETDESGTRTCTFVESETVAIFPVGVLSACHFSIHALLIGLFAHPLFIHPSFAHQQTPLRYQHNQIFL